METLEMVELVELFLKWSTGPPGLLLHIVGLDGLGTCLIFGFHLFRAPSTETLQGAVGVGTRLVL